MNARDTRRLADVAWLVGIVVFCIVWPTIECPRLDIEPQERAEAFLQLALLHGSRLPRPGWRKRCAS
jgi:hypothetical protein